MPDNYINIRWADYTPKVDITIARNFCRRRWYQNKSVRDSELKKFLIHDIDKFMDEFRQYDWNIYIDEDGHWRGEYDPEEIEGINNIEPGNQQMKLF